MDFQDRQLPIVLICWMIEKGNIEALKNLHFDKRKNLKDKIQFSFLIQNHHRYPAFKPEGRPWITSWKNRLKCI
jgi:hypothetical protein